MSVLVPVYSSNEEKTLLCDTSLWTKSFFVKGTAFHSTYYLVYCTAFNKKGDIFVGTSDGVVGLWNTKEKEAIWKFQKRSTIMSLSLSKDEKKVAYGTVESTVVIHDAKTGVLIRTILCPYLVRHVSFLPDGNRICVAHDEKCAMSLYNTNTNEMVTEFVGHEVPIECCAVFPPWILSGDRKGTIKAWNIDGSCKSTWKVHTAMVTSLCISESGSKAVSTSDDHTAIVWEISEYKAARILHHCASVTSCAIFRDEKTVCTVSLDQTANIWSMSTGHWIQTIPLGAKPFCVSLSRNESQIAVGLGNGSLTIFSRLPGVIVHSIPSYPPLSLSLDEKLLLCKGKDDYVQVHDVPTGRIVDILRIRGNPVFDVYGKLDSEANAHVQYRKRIIEAIVLIFCSGSKCSLRKKLSIWDISDVILDATVNPNFGFTVHDAKAVLHSYDPEIPWVPNSE